jgi:hypothetical protein
MDKACAAGGRNLNFLLDFGSTYPHNLAIVYEPLAQASVRPKEREDLNEGG